MARTISRLRLDDPHVDLTHLCIAAPASNDFAADATRACLHALLDTSPRYRRWIVRAYTGKTALPDAVRAISQAYNVPRPNVWAVINRFERHLASLLDLT